MIFRSSEEKRHPQTKTKIKYKCGQGVEVSHILTANGWGNEQRIELKYRIILGNKGRGGNQKYIRISWF